MPIYEYQCIDCGKTFEEFQSFSDKPVQECPFCKGRVKRLISKSVGFVFKGSGFYCTDYRSSGSSSDSSSSSCSSCTSSSCSTCGSSSSSESSNNKS
ncbi:zinc ribbon domain-containing protein [Thermatribacter velox]|uniref:Zinc ribbon domain-containing protein n=1 Tax=Thermatribacter velox TaxID=3039681 RepID=A0ABZ2YDJ8_9BACT